MKDETGTCRWCRGLMPKKAAFNKRRRYFCNRQCKNYFQKFALRYMTRLLSDGRITRQEILEAVGEPPEFRQG